MSGHSGSDVTVPHIGLPGGLQRDLRGEGQALRSGGDGGVFWRGRFLNKAFDYGSKGCKFVTSHYQGCFSSKE